MGGSGAGTGGVGKERTAPPPPCPPPAPQEALEHPVKCIFPPVTYAASVELRGAAEAPYDSSRQCDAYNGRYAQRSDLLVEYESSPGTLAIEAPRGDTWLVSAGAVMPPIGAVRGAGAAPRHVVEQCQNRAGRVL